MYYFIDAGGSGSSYGANLVSIVSCDGVFKTSADQNGFVNVNIQSGLPTAVPIISPTAIPSSVLPSQKPTALPTSKPTSNKPTSKPTVSLNPSQRPTEQPTLTPTTATAFPSSEPSTFIPSSLPSCKPTLLPSSSPSYKPSAFPSSTKPTYAPTSIPTTLPTIAALPFYQTSLPTSQKYTASAMSSNAQITYVTSKTSVYKSSNFGTTWSVVIPLSGNWSTIATSSNGVYVTAAQNRGSVYTSTDGVNFIAGTIDSFTGATMSSSGQYQALVSYSGNVYVSSNYASSWTTTSFPVNTQFIAVAMSSSTAAYITPVAFLAGAAGYIYTSSNYGSTFTANTFGKHTWRGIAVSGNGLYQYSANNQGVWTNANYGLGTWTLLSASFGIPTGVASDVTGQYSYVTWPNLNIYLSKDFGVTYNALTQSSSTVSYSSLSCDSTGLYVTATTLSSGVY